MTLSNRGTALTTPALMRFLVSIPDSKHQLGQACWVLTGLIAVLFSFLDLLARDLGLYYPKHTLYSRARQELKKASSKAMLDIVTWPLRTRPAVPPASHSPFPRFQFYRRQQSAVYVPSMTPRFRPPMTFRPPGKNSGYGWHPPCRTSPPGARSSGAASARSTTSCPSRCAWPRTRRALSTRPGPCRR